MKHMERLLWFNALEEEDLVCLTNCHRVCLNLKMVSQTVEECSLVGPCVSGCLSNLKERRNGNERGDAEKTEFRGRRRFSRSADSLVRESRPAREQPADKAVRAPLVAAPPRSVSAFRLVWQPTGQARVVPPCHSQRRWWQLMSFQSTPSMF